MRAFRAGETAGALCARALAAIGARSFDLTWVSGRAEPDCRRLRKSGQNPSVARILLGVTGGIAAYKACELVRLLVKAGHDVVPLVTRGAEEFVTRKTFFALARRSEGEDPYPHLEQAELLVVAPCTA